MLTLHLQVDRSVIESTIVPSNATSRPTSSAASVAMQATWPGTVQTGNEEPTGATMVQVHVVLLVALVAEMLLIVRWM